ncbi:sulfatase-like hydrolase/transferase [Arundinibacter roseus]|uniref:Phosphoglyceromutase n=1 Tax=Arundinibacter roseus TaxID=2070510 RepID=A0A4R4KL22_9BACT|nr:sulfatase-like hydrolase/transferase [Arundinibacter roseus]TDB69020.1 phosphoglyceromutase [Arundinibacter roseus]
MTRKFCFIFLFLGLTNSQVFSQNKLKTENVILVTMDGMRWQEVFGGVDSTLIRTKKYTPDTSALIRQFWAADPVSRRTKLMPFLWELAQNQGQLYGNRWENNYVNCTNSMWFSYPGYNEILTGSHDDEHIKSNSKTPNPNTTILEFLNKQPAWKGKVAAFGSWDVFPFIENYARSGVYVNAGYELSKDEPLSDREKLINELQETLPREWEGVRFDALTYQLAKEYLKKHRPKMLFLALGETDDFAHDARYDHYLKSAKATDDILRDLWGYLQAQPQYKGKTTLILTTDHGRGDIIKSQWTGHGDEIKDAGEIWMAVIGPDTPVLGEVKSPGQLYQNQVAQTIARYLGTTFVGNRPAGEYLKSAFK